MITRIDRRHRQGADRTLYLRNRWQNPLACNTGTMSQHRSCRTFPDAPASTLAAERHLSVLAFAKLWRCRPRPRIFSNEDGVLKFGTRETRFKPKRETLRIPESVAVRVHTRLHSRGKGWYHYNLVGEVRSQTRQQFSTNNPRTFFYGFVLRGVLVRTF